MIIFKTDLKETPECCELCPYSKPYGLVGDRLCKVTGEYFTGNVKPPYKKRPDECPLIEIEYFKRLNKFIEKFNVHAYMRNPKEDEEFFDAWELEMVKAFLNDDPETAIRVSKIILALKDVGDIKIKIE